MLIQSDTLESLLADSWAKSHGARDNYLGSGILYYALVHMLRARTCICLGSGGGFVPSLVKQAQRDLDIDGRTILIDNLSGKWGTSVVGDEKSRFRTSFPDVEFWEMSTSEAAVKLREERVEADYIHVDADHSENGVKGDWLNYREILAQSGVMTFHDTGIKSGVLPVVERIQQAGGWEVVNFITVGAGVALVKRTR